ncbi:MAG: four helix bundle protein [Lewinellaceae bacterium]|nr:four helix bundle protein [Lewinellaceae bacterium]
MTFKRFEEIEAWKLARELCRTVKQLTEKPNFFSDWELRKQIRASSGSVMDCIAEGHERKSNAEFKYFLGISQGSCGEVRSQGYRALDYGYIDELELKELHTLAIRTSAAIHALLEYLNKTNIKGLRHASSKVRKYAYSDSNFPNFEPPQMIDPNSLPDTP